MRKNYPLLATALVSKFYDLTHILIQLSDQDRITAGAVRYYSVMENPDVKRLEMWLNRKHIDRILPHKWEELIDKVTVAYNNGVQFTNRQMSLQFEDTQKQVAIRNGTIKSTGKIYVHRIDMREVGNAAREDDTDQCH